MAILLVSSAPSREIFDSVDRITRIEADRPEGMLMHAAAEQADGSVVIVDVWESADHAREFEEKRLFPAFAQAKRPMDNPPTRLETFQLVRG
jgi:hypothetical protein